MKYEDMNFKVPVESESYKEDSEFVIEQITQILDRQRQKGDNRIVINTNLRMGLPLENINIDIKSGETIGIIGGTGSSKSTIVNLIPRLYDVTKGSIKVGGIDVRDYDIETLRNEVAVVLQKNVLFSGTIKDNLKWGNKDASDDEIIRVCKLAQADSFIQEFPDKYDTILDQGGTNVSGLSLIHI